MGVEEKVSWRQAIIIHKKGYVLYLEDGALTVQEILVGPRTQKNIFVKFFPKEGDEGSVETILVKSYVDGTHSYFMVSNAELGRFYHSNRDLQQLQLRPLGSDSVEDINQDILSARELVSNIIGRHRYFELSSLPQNIQDMLGSISEMTEFSCMSQARSK